MSRVWSSAAPAAPKRVRDHARAAFIADKYPDGRMPDGRRIVHIGIAA